VAWGHPLVLVGAHPALTLTSQPTGELDLDQRGTQMAILSNVIHGQADLSIPPAYKIDQRLIRAKAALADRRARTNDGGRTRRHPNASGDRNAPSTVRREACPRGRQMQ
jgi:hypothetical protein